MSDFSHEGFCLHPELRDKSKPISTEWLKGPKITAENLKRGTSSIELLSAPEWIKPQKTTGSAKTGFGGGGAKTGQNPAIFARGKHAGKLYVDVLEEDPGYMRWCAAELPGFREKLVKAGINPDEI